MIPQVKCDKMNFVQHPIINGLQKMVVYRTRSMFYIIGTNIVQSKFRILKVDRTVPNDLVLTDDKVEYSPTEIKKVISMLNDGNKVGLSAKGSSGATRNVSAFGILGFIRFLEGYYIILITKREKVAVIGHHSIYKIADTSIMCIPHESVRIPHEDEQKYVRTFNSIDLTGNFYFSYTYDLSNSLQYNMAPFSNIREYIQDKTEETFMNPNGNKEKPSPNQKDKKFHVACKTNPNWKFVWNHFLLQELISNVHDTWILPVTHGFINQISIPTSAKIIHLALLARRSAKYAGTRFLKRGTNSEGDVANEVETEQIVYDTNFLSLHQGNFTSFVQIRGSIPAYWSHLGSLPKPPIKLDLADTYAKTSGKHFNKLFKRFGSPVIVLNLVKQQQREGKKTKECILNDEYVRIINQLNITLPKEHHIQHISLDMANIKKTKNEDVMEHLNKVAYRAVKQTGIFQSSPSPYALHLNPNSDKQLEKTSFQRDKKFGSVRSSECVRTGRDQTGVIRVNCVDCLDRTNTAMYAVAKCALGFQLNALGVLEIPVVENGSECGKMLQALYDDHGDTLAHQYAGSNLVHRIDSYQQTSGWTDQGRDLMESGRRYYKNTYEDQEKQRAINIFLGVLRPTRIPPSEAELSKDANEKIAKTLAELRASSSAWLDSRVMENFPLPVDQLLKYPTFAFLVKPDDTMINMFNDFYRYNEYVTFSMCFHFNMEQCSRNAASVDQNVFSVPMIQKKYSEESMLFSKTSETALLGKNVSSLHPDSQGSVHMISSPCDSGGESSDDEDLKLESFFPPTETTLGDVYDYVPEESIEQYKKYARMAEQSSGERKERLAVDFNTLSIVYNLETYSLPFYSQLCEQPVQEVNKASVKMYEDYVSTNYLNIKGPTQEDMEQYYKISM